MRVTLENLEKSYGDTVALDGISLVCEEGQLTTLLGPSGCGKTTTLRCAAGLEMPDAGRISIGDDVVFDREEGIFVPIQNRNIGFVFQSFDVWPHLDVFENVAYPLRFRDFSESEIEEKVDDVLELTNIAELKRQGAATLSGGQQARVSISRALVYEPRVLFFDEPLTGLDRNLRKRMRVEIRRIQTNLGITAIYVTHSQPEALTLSDKLCLMSPGGTIAQVGTPDEVYDEPTSDYSFEFFGSSEFIPGTVVSDGVAETPIGTLQIHNRGQFSVGDAIKIGLRPEAMQILDAAPDEADNVFEGVIETRSYLGNEFEFDVRIGDRLVQVLENSRKGKGVGDTVQLRLKPEDIHIFLQ